MTFMRCPSHYKNNLRTLNLGSVSTRLGGFRILYLYFVFKAFIKPFKALQRSVKIKIYVNFLSLSETEMGNLKVKMYAKQRSKTC